MAHLYAGGHGGSPGGCAARNIIAPFDSDQDCTSFDKETWLSIYDAALANNQMSSWFRELKLCSPESPWLTCDQIVNHWDAKKAPEWEESHGGYPSVVMLLGTTYAGLKQWDDAERCLKAYIDVSPDESGYETLANLYWVQSRKDLWLATLKDFLAKTESIALEHAQVQVQIADYYMGQRRYREAIPFADAAAETGAGWGSLCAAAAHTGVGDFDHAEQLYAEVYQHYGDTPYEWYGWCVRTGHGHRDDAGKALRDYFEKRGNNLSNEDLLQEAFMEASEGDLAAAILVLQQRLKQFPGPISLAHIMVFADEIGDTAARDAAIRRAPKLRSPSKSLVEFTKALAAAYKAGPDTPLDSKAVESMATAADPADQMVIYCLAARYVSKRGHKDIAADYLKRCYFGFTGYAAEMLLVEQGLRDAGIDPMELTNPATQPSN